MLYVYINFAEDVGFLTPTRPSDCRYTRPSNAHRLSLLLSPRRRTVKRYTSDADLWCIPGFLLEYVFSFLHIHDLLNLLQVSYLAAIQYVYVTLSPSFLKCTCNSWYNVCFFISSTIYQCITVCMSYFRPTLSSMSCLEPAHWYGDMSGSPIRGHLLVISNFSQSKYSPMNPALVTEIAARFGWERNGPKTLQVFIPSLK